MESFNQKLLFQQVFAFLVLYNIQYFLLNVKKDRFSESVVSASYAAAPVLSPTAGSPKYFMLLSTSFHKKSAGSDCERGDAACAEPWLRSGGYVRA